MAHPSLRRVFDEYCAPGHSGTMEGKSFLKLSKDCGLLDRQLTATDVDIIFTKIKITTDRRITYDQFLDGLMMFAKKKGVPVEAIEGKVEISTGPAWNGTVAEPNRFHDDKNLYTGTHKVGGPSTLDTDKIANLSSLMDRSNADVRGVKYEGVGAYNSGGPGQNLVEARTLRSSSGRQILTVPCSDTPRIREVYEAYCAGQKSMDGKYFAKLAKDCKLLGKGLTGTDVDLTFAKVKDREEKRISYSQFLFGLGLFAEKKGVSSERIEEIVSRSEGPILHGTVAEPNKYHDDKSYYTGVHAFGGPSTIDTDKISNLSQLTDRSPADDRGMQFGKVHLMERSVRKDQLARSSSDRRLRLQTAAAVAPLEDSGELRRVFDNYAVGQPTMDGRYFAKLAVDCELLDRHLTATDMDLTFNKVKEREMKRISYLQFLEGLGIVAAKKGLAPFALSAIVSQCDGPILNGTVAEPNKFHDDKSFYTGVHAYGGPSTVDTDKVSSLASLLDRSPANERGVRISQGPRSSSAASDASSAWRMLRDIVHQPSGRNLLRSAGGRKLAIPIVAAADTPALTRVFASYAGGHPTLDGASFAKLMRDTSLLDGRLTVSEVDLAFAKVKALSDRRITYMQFLEALGVVGAKKGMHMEALVARVERAQAGPLLRGTVPEATRFHDDRSLSTGVHASGGSEVVDPDQVASLSQYLDRSPADNRGVKTMQPALRTVSARNLDKSTTSSAVLARPPSITEPLAPVRPPSSEEKGGSGVSAKLEAMVVAESGPAESMGEVFQRFCAGQVDMDGRQFAKFSRDCQLLSAQLTSTDVDLIFAKVKGDPKARRIALHHFLAALELCAAKRGEQLDVLKSKILAHGGPRFAGTRAEYSKFHDDKSTYSGMYADIHASAGAIQRAPSTRGLVRAMSSRDPSKSSPVSSQELWTQP